uniref:BPTI/Kunitz inhibitor domain-containing protein n=1 Tax=Heterorhabditis bacteriophora TaxID=37862 RepID=A0A1I7XV54_HETBA
MHRKKCTSLHWGGCQSDSKNFFIDMGQCQELCEMPMKELTDGCIEPFDDGYRASCSSDGRFQQYYFSIKSLKAVKCFGKQFSDIILFDYFVFKTSSPQTRDFY